MIFTSLRAFKCSVKISKSHRGVCAVVRLLQQLGSLSRLRIREATHSRFCMQVLVLLVTKRAVARVTTSRSRQRTGSILGMRRDLTSPKQIRSAGNGCNVAALTLRLPIGGLPALILGRIDFRVRNITACWRRRPVNTSAEPWSLCYGMIAASISLVLGLRSMTTRAARMGESSPADACATGRLIWRESEVVPA